VILDPDYARIFTQARLIAHQYGYSASLHGSYTRDLDILLTPWTAEARGNAEQLVRLIAQANEGLLHKPSAKYGEMVFSKKPHGRLAFSLHFVGFGDHRFVDISIMPIIAPAQEPYVA
jgi:hypothetical protein